MTDPTPAEPARRHTVDTITSDELDALQDERDLLRAEADRLHRRHDSHDALQYALGGLTDQRLARAAQLAADERDRAYAAEQRAERAEAALERVRKALHAISIDIGRHRGTSDPEMLAYRLGLIDADRQLRAALDEQQEQQRGPIVVIAEEHTLTNEQMATLAETAARHPHPNVQTFGTHDPEDA